MTSHKSQMTKSETSDTLTQFAEDFRAKLSALLDVEEDSKILEELSSLKSQDSPLYSNLSICSLKMSKDYLTTTKEIPEVILSALDELGYDVEWQVLNSKDFGVPQNRERVFIIGHLRGERGRKVFPIGGNGATIDCEQPKINKVGNIRKKGKSQSGDVVSVDSLAPTLCSTTTQKDPLKIFLAGNLPGSHEQNGRVYDPNGISPTLNTMQGGDRQPKIRVREATKQGYAEASVGDSVNLSHPNSKTRRGRVGEGVANTIVTGDSQGVVTPNFRIRKLTPRECWRLQGFPDWAFDKAQEVNSNSQLYKQAGNSVAVNVIKEIARYL